MSNNSFVGGSLKLKNGPALHKLAKNLKKPGKKLKPKKESMMSRQAKKDEDEETLEEFLRNEALQNEKSERVEEVKEGMRRVIDDRTASEKRFDDILKQRQIERIDKKLELTHREKIEKFNKQLAKLPEHFDIPRVGPG